MDMDKEEGIDCGRNVWAGWMGEKGKNLVQL